MYTDKEYSRLYNKVLNKLQSAEITRVAHHTGLSYSGLRYIRDGRKPKDSTLELLVEYFEIK